MSYKIDKDDPELLEFIRVRKQKAADAPSDDIKTDEYVCMRDGRFTCLVCGAHHVFESIDSLQTHNSTKSHLRKLFVFQKRKADRLQNIEQRLSDPNCSEADRAIFLEKRLALMERDKFCKAKGAKFGRQLAAPKVKVELANISPSELSTVNPWNEAGTWKNIDTCPDGKTYYHSRCLISRELRYQASKRELDMLSKGWLRDDNGDWVQDPNAEYDSDNDGDLLMR